MEVDMRSSDAASLKALDDKFKAALQEAVEEENKRWNNRGPVTVSAELVGVRPGGAHAGEQSRSCRPRWPFRAHGLSARRCAKARPIPMCR